MAEARRDRQNEIDAWTEFWAEPGQSSCAARSPAMTHALSRHWSAFARLLARGTRVLDLGCGSGAVGKYLLDARPDLRVTGIDAARVPPPRGSNLALLAGTCMESLPFADRSFGAVVSQFGLEYADMNPTAREIARVAAPGARVSFVVHHARSVIVAGMRARLRALDVIFASALRAAFCAGDARAFTPLLAALRDSCPEDDLIALLARELPARLRAPAASRLRIWNSLESALAPERCIAEALDAACVDPARIDDWLVPLCEVCNLARVAELREPGGALVAWRIEASVARPGSAPQVSAAAS
jgi:SAM-dependent methyltransferase